eukprot:PhM_4_TR9746/c4_g1_i1/m.99891/K04421/MAP3K3, MEKK3; mitogen-activated protein kinase kinase kinase 3
MSLPSGYMSSSSSHLCEQAPRQFQQQQQQQDVRNVMTSAEEAEDTENYHVARNPALTALHRGLQLFQAVAWLVVTIIIAASIVHVGDVASVLVVVSVLNLLSCLFDVVALTLVLIRSRYAGYASSALRISCRITSLLLEALCVSGSIVAQNIACCAVLFKVAPSKGWGALVALCSIPARDHYAAGLSRFARNDVIARKVLLFNVVVVWAVATAVAWDHDRDDSDELPLWFALCHGLSVWLAALFPWDGERCELLAPTPSPHEMTDEPRHNTLEEMHPDTGVMPPITESRGDGDSVEDMKDHVVPVVMEKHNTKDDDPTDYTAMISSTGSCPLSPNGKSRVLDRFSTTAIDQPSTTDAMGKTINWRKGALLGSGAFGTVHVALNQDTAEMMAVKFVEFRADDPDLVAKLKILQTEITVLKQFNHENIVKYFFVEKVDKTGVNIFMEYVPGGSISNILSNFGSLAELVVVQYTHQILRGLAYLHRNNVIHGDIKSANILLAVQGVVKLADFGSAVIVVEQQSQSAGGKLSRGTPVWMAPELIRGEGLTWRSDIWSLGCTVMEMLTGRYPWW